jgi:hypothetical protein
VDGGVVTLTIPDLRLAAQRYADGLAPGDRILDELDGPTVTVFFHLLPGLLYKRGLLLQSIPGGWIVRAVPTMVLPAPGPVPVECRICGGSWFSGECEHGIGNVVVVR